MIISFVHAIIAMADPLTVAWLVIAAVINAVYCIFWWTIPHVIKESEKRISPFLGNLNTSSTIIGVIARLWIVAALNHATPNIEFPRFALAVRCFSATGCAIMTRCLSLEIAALGFYCASTITKAFPVWSKRIAAKLHEANNFQMTKHLSGEVFKFAHASNYIPMTCCAQVITLHRKFTYA